MLSIEYILERNRDIHLGTIVMYSFLFALCFMVCFGCTSKSRSHGLFLTSLICICGVISSATFLGYASDFNIDTYKGLLCAGLFFGLTLTPLTWMVGITFISSLVKDKTPVQLWVSYFITLVQFVLIVADTCIFSNFMNSWEWYDLGNDRLWDVYKRLATSIDSLNWVYFLLFFSLLIQYRRYLHGSVMATAILFCILNTVNLVADTVSLALENHLPFKVYCIILLFFTDFVSSVSLYFTVLFWRNIQKEENEINS